MSKSQQWPQFGPDEKITDGIYYRACSARNPWRRVSDQHYNLWNAVFGDNGAKSLFDPAARLYQEREPVYGVPQFVAVWDINDETNRALLINGKQVALMAAADIEDLEDGIDEGIYSPAQIRQELDRLFTVGPKRLMSEYEAALLEAAA